MDFSLSDEQKDIQKAAMEFAQGEFDPNLSIELDQKREFPEAQWKKAARLGFIGVDYPEEFGGQGLGLFERLLVTEAFCRVDSGIGSALSSVDTGSEIVLRFGSMKQKRDLIPPLAKGEKRLSVAFAESEDGKDFSQFSTTGKKREDGYMLFGEKRFVVNATLSDAFITLCKESKERWVTLIVERGEGIEAQPVEKMGLRMIPQGVLRFDGVLVASDMRIGGENEGVAPFHYYQQVAGLKSLAQALGLAQGAFDRAVQYSKQREQFGRKLSQFQVIRHKLADMGVSIEVARWLTYKSVTEFDQEKTNGRFLSMTQLEVGRRLIEVVNEALQIFGGYGYMAEQAIEHYYRDAWVIGVELGTEEEHKDEIAERILGGQ